MLCSVYGAPDSEKEQKQNWWEMAMPLNKQREMTNLTKYIELKIIALKNYWSSLLVLFNERFLVMKSSCL